MGSIPYIDSVSGAKGARANSPGVRQVATDNRITVGPKYSPECHERLAKLAKREGVSVTHLIERAGYTLVGMAAPDAGTRGKRSLFELIVGHKPSKVESEHVKVMLKEYGTRKLDTKAGKDEFANELLGWVKTQAMNAKPAKPAKPLPKPAVEPAAA